MRIVFDLDDTICRTRNRDYANAEPLYGVIEKIRAAKSMGNYIIIHTARGMLSCNGNVEKAEKKNRKIIEDWLANNNVPYDEIIFGKPYADLYIDDKALNVPQWRQTGIELMTGFSGKPVYHVGEYVIKPTEDTAKVREWYDACSKLCTVSVKVPEIYSAGNGNITMEYIKGDVLSKVFHTALIPRLVLVTLKFRQVQDGKENDLSTYADFIEERANGCYGDFVREFRKQITAGKFKILQKCTFCHGDFTLQNIIADGNTLYLIDPSIKPWNNYLFDAAKMRASLNGLDAAISETGRIFQDVTEIFDSYYSEQEVEEIRWIEITHFIRVRHFAEKMNNSRSLGIIDNCIEILISKL